MRKGKRAHLLSIVCTFWLLGLLPIHAKNGKSQQTFVVRYKNGEHTVPVTVVLDYKKQTEYVINMSPRAATKTVTLYDFKQKTIAYKDLTNRECFLGRLTHESLREEIDALTNIENPVERRPKVLSLDPERPSLTPTEIRNMAGQKTAVFCGKMNTWLVLAKENHNIQKREVEEVDERTFHRQGYHTVRYSHFGTETRRRYRNSKTRGSPQRTAGKAEIPSESSPTRQLEYPSFQHHYLSPSSQITSPNGKSQQVHHMPIGKGDLYPVPTLSASFTPNSDSGTSVSSASQLNGPNGQNEYDVQLRFPPTGIQTPNYGVTTEGRNDDKGDLTNLEEANKSFGAFDSTVSNSEPTNLMVHSHDADRRNLTFNLNEHPSQTSVKDESIPFVYGSNANHGKFYLKTSDGHDILEDPGVSSNVPKIPLAAKKLDNSGEPSDFTPIIQTDEDVHDVFEGFFNLGKNNPISEHLYNSYFIHPEPNGGREHNYPEDSLIDSRHSSSSSRIKNDKDKGLQWQKNIPKLTEIITPTDHSSANSYSDYNEPAISPKYSDSFSDIERLENKKDNFDNVDPTPQKVVHTSRSRSIELSQPVSPKKISENNLIKEEDVYFTIESPSEVITNTEHSVYQPNVFNKNKFAETAKNLTSSNFDKNLQETADHQDLYHSGIPSHQLRLQNALRSYKPDQIVIDVENIPTQSPAENTLSFQGQLFSPNSITTLNLSKNFNPPISEQTSGDMWRGRPIRKSNLSNRKTHNSQASSRTSYQHKQNESSLFQRRMPNNNVRQLVYSSPQTLPRPAYDAHGSYKLGSLPPGVSIHPRHPNAPYAGAVHSKVLPPASQQRAVLSPVSIGRTPKLHRQRHHRKKDRSLNSCCRSRGNSKTCCGSCCRSKSLRIKPSCCSSTKLEHIQKPTQTSAPLLINNKLAEDPRNRCQKEKLCRTLYESTQQVMVCRNANIDGC